jgi:hypothetical protein
MYNMFKIVVESENETFTCKQISIGSTSCHLHHHTIKQECHLQKWQNNSSLDEAQVCL